MSDNTNPIYAAIMAQHAARRAANGVTGTGTRAAIKSRAVANTGERAARLLEERDAARASIDWDYVQNLGVRADAVRCALKAELELPITASRSRVASALEESESPRAARLAALLALINTRRNGVTGEYWAETMAGHLDLRPGGLFHRYAQYHYNRPGQNLGMLSFDAGDIVSESVELCYQWLAADGIELADISAVASGPWIAGGQNTGIPLGLMYRAIKTVYRRGLGIFGNTQRGKLSIIDGEGHVHAVESDSIIWAREESAARDAALRAARVAMREGDASPLFPLTPEEEQTRDLIARRARAMETLANRFPVNADGKMLALAAMLAEGYTVDEFVSVAGVTPTTANRWAGELASIAQSSFAPKVGGNDAALNARLAAYDARIAQRDLSVHVSHK